MGVKRMKMLVSFFNRIMQRYLPDPFLFVIILTFVVFGLGLFLQTAVRTRWSSIGAEDSGDC